MCVKKSSYCVNKEKSRKARQYYLFPTARRCSRRIWASLNRRFSSSVFGAIGGIGVGLPLSSRATNVRYADTICLSSYVRKFFAKTLMPISIEVFQARLIAPLNTSVSPCRPGARNLTESIKSVTHTLPVWRWAMPPAIRSISCRTVPPNTVLFGLRSLGNISYG